MSNGRLRQVAACALIGAIWGGQRAAAQSPPMLPETNVVQAGPASLYPAIALRNVGADSNVYNDWTFPREDFTYTVTPRLFAVVPIASTRFIGTGTGDFVYYQTYQDQQTVNGFFQGWYEVVDARFRPFASASLATHRERQGFEIDARARQTQTAIAFGAKVEMTPITSLTGWVRRETTSWDRSEQYLGVFLSEQLNLTTDIVAAGARFQVTPLTAVIAVAEIQRDRFEMSPDRDADSLRLAPSVEFDNGAVLSGQARAGYRIFRPLNPAIAEYRGMTASAGLQYRFADDTRVSLDGGHDMKYSFDPLQPYYLETGVRIKVIQRIVGPFNAVGIGERWGLRHQRIGGRSFDGRRENVATIGGGVGIRLSREIELTFIIERARRTSSEPVGRSFERRRTFASISYGL